MGIFARAGAYLNLTPGERALLRFGEGLAVSAAISGVQAVMPLLNSGVNPSAIPWVSVSHTFIATALGAFGAAAMKFFKAQGDPALPPPTLPLPNPPAVAPAAAAAPTVPPIVDAQAA